MSAFLYVVLSCVCKDLAVVKFHLLRNTFQCLTQIVKDFRINSQWEKSSWPEMRLPKLSILWLVQQLDTYLINYLPLNVKLVTSTSHITVPTPTRVKFAAVCSMDWVRKFYLVTAISTWTNVSFRSYRYRKNCWREITWDKILTKISWTAVERLIMYITPSYFIYTTRIKSYKEGQWLFLHQQMQ